MAYTAGAEKGGGANQYTQATSAFHQNIFGIAMSPDPFPA